MENRRAVPKTVKMTNICRTCHASQMVHMCHIQPFLLLCNTSTVAGSYSDGDRDIYIASLGSQASNYGFGPPMARTRRGSFRSSYDPSIRLRAGPNFRGTVCPEGHMCRFKEYAAIRFCDECVAEIAAGSVGERCTLCDFDLCPQCSSNSQAKITSEAGSTTVNPVQDGSSPPLSSVHVATVPSNTIPALSEIVSEAGGEIDIHVQDGSSPPAPSVHVAAIPSNELPSLKIHPYFLHRPRIITDTALPEVTVPATLPVDNASCDASSNTFTAPSVIATCLLPALQVTNLTPVLPKCRLGVHRMKLTIAPKLKSGALSTSTVTSPSAALCGKALLQVACSKASAPAASVTPAFKLASVLAATVLPSAAATAATGQPASFESASLPAAVPLPSPAAQAASGPATSNRSSGAATPTSPPSSTREAAASSPLSPVSSWEAFQDNVRRNPGKRFGISLGIQCNVPDLLFVNARVPQNKPPYVHSAPFSDRREPTFELPVREGQRGNTYDLGNALLKPVAVYVQGAQVVRQPRDGHCLYHALIHGLGHTLSILDLRKELSEFVRKNPGLIAHGHPLSTWIMWECHCRCVCVCVCVCVSVFAINV